MIPVVELDQISQARLEDAKCLLSAGRFDGATYICGYAVEVGLKARICRTLNWPDFPSTPKEFQPYRSFQTHDLEVLLHLTGQEERIKQLQTMDRGLPMEARITVQSSRKYGEINANCPISARRCAGPLGSHRLRPMGMGRSR